MQIKYKLNIHNISNSEWMESWAALQSLFNCSRVAVVLYGDLFVLYLNL